MWTRPKRKLIQAIFPSSFSGFYLGNVYLFRYFILGLFWMRSEFARLDDMLEESEGYRISRMKIKDTTELSVMFE